MTGTPTPTPTLGAGCPLVPETCLSAGRNSVRLQNVNADPFNRKLSWTWQWGLAPSTQADFGNPLHGAQTYKLCLYDQSGGAPVFKMGVYLAPGGTCGSKPCWRAVRHIGWEYRNTAENSEGITQVRFSGGIAGRPTLKVKGKGYSLALPSPVSPERYFEQDTAVLMQLYRNDLALCWSSHFDGPSTRTNNGLQFRAKTR